METLTFALIGSILVTHGWHWGGVSEGRTTAIANGLAAGVLAVAAAFGIATLDPAIAVLAALGAIFGTLVALDAHWELTNDRTLGLFSLLLAVGAVLLAAAFAAGGEFTLAALAAIGLAVAFGLVFVSSALVPEVPAFRRFVGWVALLVGAGVFLIGFAPLLDVTI